MNGYFQLQIENHKTDIMIYPPTDDGVKVDMKEITRYLADLGVNYDLQELTKAVIQVTHLQHMEMRTLQFHEIPYVSERAEVILSHDNMEAYIRLIPPSNEGHTYTKADILHLLSQHNVIQAVDAKKIDLMLEEHEYCKDYLVAVGKDAEQGTEGFIEYCFDVDRKARPTLKDDGTVDFFNLNALNDCSVGDVLAVMTREIQGTPGYNVIGVELSPRIPKKMILKYGRNIQLSEDGLSITSLVNGHVSLVDDRVFVSDLYTVEDVDTSTGNINYDGNVLINGNVCSGYKVYARGNVEVRGIVEGADIEAGGDIIIARGMNGRGKGTLKAGGNVIAKYFENTTVIAQGYIETEAVMHCELSSSAEINVVGRKGYIIGGRTTAFSAVHVKNLGSPMGGATIVQVGFQPERVARIAELEVLMEAIKKEYEMVAPTLKAVKLKICNGVKLHQAQLDQFRKLAEDAKGKQEMYLEAEQEIAMIRLQMSTENKSVVTVESTVYPETTVLMSNLTYVVTHAIKYCKFVKVAGDIVMESL